MKLVTKKYKIEIKKYGRQLDAVITYNDGKEHLLDSDVLFSITPVVNGNILKSVMKELSFESSVKVPKGTTINVKFGVLVNLGLTVAEVNAMKVNRLNSMPVKMLSTLKGYEYINLGNYIVAKDPEYNADTFSYTHICYDKMLYTMKNYEKLDITYPISIRDYINKTCEHLGLAFKNFNDTFANYDKQIKSDLYDGYDYTFRDIFDELAQVTASTICINENTDELEVRYINDTQDMIDEDYLKDTNVGFKEKYGPINSVVLSRAAESDNVFLRDEQSVKTNGLYEIKIVDNQIMNGNDRSDFLPDILEKLNGLEYYINDFDSTGITWYELCDKYTVKIGENLYNCVLFNDAIKISQGLEESIYTEMPETSETDYSKADKTDRKINKAYIMVDKQNQKIESLISQQTETGNKLTQVEQTVDGITQTVSSVETKIETVENKADIAQETADNAQNTANMANTNAQNAQDVADEAISKITTTTEKLTQVEQTVDGITQSVSEVETKIETVETKADNAQSSANNAQDTADSINESLTTNYYTKTETNSQISQKANEIEMTVQQEINTITGENSIRNGTFENGLQNWNIFASQGDIQVTEYNNKKYAELITMNGETKLTQTITGLIEEIDYKLSFKVLSKSFIPTGTTFTTKIWQTKNNSEELILLKSQEVELNETEKSISIEFNMLYAGDVDIEFGLNISSFSSEEISAMVTDVVVAGGSVSERFASLKVGLDGIESEVSKKVGNNEVISKINQSSETVGINANKIELSANDVLNLLAGNTINLSGKSIKISSNNFNVDANGKMTCKGAEISGKVIVGGDEEEPEFIATDGNFRTTVFPLGLLNEVNGEYAAVMKGGLGVGTYTSTGMSEKVTINSEGIIAPKVTQTSLAEQKKNFEKMQNFALNIIKTIDIYKYNLKSEKDTDKKHIGFVIGDDYKYAKEVTSIDNTGVDNYSFTSLCCKAIQEQQQQIEQLQKEIQELRKEEN